jgi:hypothetical protein
MGEPQFAVLRRPVSCDRVYNLAHLEHVGLPHLLVVEKVHIHQLVDHVYHVVMDLAQLAILSDKLGGPLLDLLVVLLDLDWV